METNATNKSKILYPELSYELVGLCFDIHNERQYSDALEQKLKENNLTYVREVRLEESFEGEMSGGNIADFIVEDKIVVELKAKRIILKGDYYQLKRYLASSPYKLGILINFRSKYITPKRVLHSHSQHS